jgi:hypothetical protein
MSAVEELCARWDALSKGESETTKQIRAAAEADLGAVRRVAAWCGDKAGDMAASGHGAYAAGARDAYEVTQARLDKALGS